MSGERSNGLLEQLRGLVLAEQDGGRSDGELLARYLADRDEAAFAALVHRHGALVWGVCRRLLPDVHDAEDAFQATFLILARKASSIRRQHSVGSWLHGVACRVARKLRAGLAWCAAPPPPDERTVADPADDVSWREVKGVLDEELGRLPEKYRAPLLLCYLEGLTQDEAARRLGWKRGVLRGRLDRGRQRLRQRLERRGLGLSAALLGAALGGPVTAAPAALAVAAVGAAAGAPLSVNVVALTEGVLRAMLMTKLKLLAMVVLVVCLGGLSVALLSRPAVAQPPGDLSRRSAPKLPPPDRPDLERRVAELEKQVARLTKEVAELRGGPKAKGSDAPGEPKAKGSDAPGEGETKIFRLRNAAAEEINKVMNEAFGKGRCVIVADASSNSLIVRGTATDLETIEALLARLDDEAVKGPVGRQARTAARQVKTFSLKGKDAQQVAQALSKVLEGTTARVTAVGASAVLVYGSTEELLLAAEVIKQIDDAAKEAPPDRDPLAPSTVTN
jgi:RNA polymerase sigma factor (sigma-70 family)